MNTYLYNSQYIAGILPTNQEAKDFVMQQRRQQYDDLMQTLTVMQRINETTPTATIHLKMFLVEQGRLPLKENKLVRCIA